MFRIAVPGVLLVAVVLQLKTHPDPLLCGAASMPRDREATTHWSA